jgi:hypothetical protein
MIALSSNPLGKLSVVQEDCYPIKILFPRPQSPLRAVDFEEVGNLF